MWNEAGAMAGMPMFVWFYTVVMNSPAKVQDFCGLPPNFLRLFWENRRQEIYEKFTTRSH
jgi:hypothetical protein